MNGFYNFLSTGNFPLIIIAIFSIYKGLRVLLDEKQIAIALQYLNYFIICILLWVVESESHEEKIKIAKWVLLFIFDDWNIIADYIIKLKDKILISHWVRVVIANLFLVAFIPFGLGSLFSNEIVRWLVIMSAAIYCFFTYCLIMYKPVDLLIDETRRQQGEVEILRNKTVHGKSFIVDHSPMILLVAFALVILCLIFVIGGVIFFL